MYSSIYRYLFKNSKRNEKNKSSKEVLPKVRKPPIIDSEPYVDRTPDDDGDADT